MIIYEVVWSVAEGDTVEARFTSEAEAKRWRGRHSQFARERLIIRQASVADKADDVPLAESAPMGSPEQYEQVPTRSVAFWSDEQGLIAAVEVAPDASEE